MKAAPFRYHRAESVRDAVDHLGDPDTVALAGGQSLVPMVVMRLARPAVLVDINRLDALDGVEATEGALDVGAIARQRRLERSPDTARVPLLAAALPFIGHREIRNRGTVGGSIMHADPSAELPCVVATLDAQLTLEGRDGTRRVGGRTFFTGPFQTAKRDGELLTGVRFPTAGDGDGFDFSEVARRHGDFALCGVAAHVRRLDGALRTATVGVLGVGDRPVVMDAAPALEASLDGPAPFDEVARALAEDLDPGGDLHASPSYRRRLARVLIGRCLRTAYERAGEEAR